MTTNIHYIHVALDAMSTLCLTVIGS